MAKPDPTAKNGWKFLSQRQIFEHPRLSLAEDRVRLPSGDEINYLRFNPDLNDYVTIIAEADDGRILMVEEYAYPIDRTLLQFPEGLLDSPDEDVLLAAERELRQEVGMSAGDYEVVGSNLGHHRRSRQVNHIVRATGLIEAPLDADVEEQGIAVVSYTDAEIWDLIQQGKIIQKNTLAAWTLYQASKRA